MKSTKRVWLISQVLSVRKTQGEAQQKLDVYANEKFKSALEARDQVCGVASEEEDEAVAFNKELNKNAKYVVLMDPLDGFIEHRRERLRRHHLLDLSSRVANWHTTDTRRFLQPGHKQVAAGYVIYGSSTMLVYTTGNGVNGFTYDPSLGNVLSIA